MKKIFFYMMTVTVVLATSCSNGDNLDLENGPNRITLLTQYPDLGFGVAGPGGTVSIDWGDKTGIKTYTLLDFYSVGWQTYVHEYVDGAATHTVTITGDSITWFSCINTGTIQLEVRKNPALEILSCEDNRLTSLDVSHNTALRTLFCDGNEILDLDVSKNTELGNFWCYNNRIKDLDISKNTKLYSLRCDNNELTKLDVSKNTALESFICYENQLTQLDVSNNPKLSHLWCFSNRLSDLDVSNNTELEQLYCYNNPLTKLDVSANNKLFYLGCMTNDLSSQSLNELFETLHNNTIPTRTKFVFIYGNPGTDDCDTSIATSKGWIVNKNISSLN